MSSLPRPPLTMEDIERYRAAVGARPGDIVPNPGPQTAFLQSGAHEVLGGGAAGGSKTFGLLLAALRRVDTPGYKALLLRREYPELRRTLLEKAKKLYPGAGGRWIAGEKTWLFPATGATIEFGSAPHEESIERYQGGEYSFLGFDELTHFTERQYKWLFGRMRSAQGIEMRIRCASNPGSRGHDWVLKRWAPWLYPPGHPGYEGPYADDGQVLWFRPAGEDSDEEVLDDGSHPDAVSRTFIRSFYTDTPQTAQQYGRMLAQMGRLDRKRLGKGDWMARDAAGEYFERGWFELVDHVPDEVIYRLRYWDLAGTEQRKTTPSSAWTAGLRLSITRRRKVFLEHMKRGQWSPGTVAKTIDETAEEDRRFDDRCETVIERDPAQAGKFQQWFMATAFPEHGIRAVPPQGDKLVRARVVSPQVELGNVAVVRAAWNEAFFREAESFPEETKDQIDALSGGFRQLMIRARKILGTAGSSDRDPPPRGSRVQMPRAPRLVRPGADIAREVQERRRRDR